MKQSEYIDLIPLNQAVLCENCSQISCSKTDYCNGCGSSATISLAGLLSSVESASNLSVLGALRFLPVVSGSQRVSH